MSLIYPLIGLGRFGAFVVIGQNYHGWIILRQVRVKVRVRHGQMYVAFSRVRNSKSVTIHVNDKDGNTKTLYLCREVL